MTDDAFTRGSHKKFMTETPIDATVGAALVARGVEKLTAHFGRGSWSYIEILSLIMAEHVTYVDALAFWYCLSRALDALDELSVDDKKFIVQDAYHRFVATRLRGATNPGESARSP